MKTIIITGGTGLIGKALSIHFAKAGNKVVMETTDLLKVTGSGATDVCLSIMEIT